MDANVLFLKTLADIKSRISENDPYEILLIAGLLRKLFLDDHPLVDQVNRTHKLRLEFEVTISVDKPADDDKDSLWSVQDGFDPGTARPGKPCKRLSRDQFFQETVAMVFGHRYTVRDVIQFGANIAGAVHAGSPKTEKEKALHALSQALSIGGHEPALRQLLAIARVSLKTLEPLSTTVTAA